ncbi:MAG: hypothetical protein MUP55_01035, partial [Candidatus Aenigmarchaeota archaeon]|nr:hypothetical protein [Candidatus Aenigmarchaeota archaeon]
MSTPKPEEKNELVLEIHAGLMKELLATILVIEDGEFKLKTTKDWVSYCGVDPSHVCKAGFDVPTIKL